MRFLFYTLMVFGVLLTSCRQHMQEPEVKLTLADIKMPDAERPCREKNKVQWVWVIGPFGNRLDTFSWTRVNRKGLETYSRSGRVMSSHHGKKYNADGWLRMEIYSSCNTTRFFCYYYNDTRSRTLYKLDVEDNDTGRFQNSGHGMQLWIYKYDARGLIYECMHVWSPWGFALDYYTYDEQQRLVKSECYIYTTDRESYPFRLTSMSDPYYIIKGYHYTGQILDSGFSQMFGDHVDNTPTIYHYENGLLKTARYSTSTLQYRYGYYN